MRFTGTVKWFNNEQGYGFLTPDEDGPECFVHHTALHGNGVKTLDEGDTVEFDLVHSPKGPAAENVARLR